MPYKEGKKWRGVVKSSGKRYTKLFLTKTKALEWELEKKEKLRREKTDTVYLRETAEAYLDYCKARYIYQTYLDKKRVLKELAGLTGDIPITEIRSDLILNEILLKKASSNLFNRTRKDLHSFFEYCRVFYRLSLNPVYGIQKLPVKRQSQPVPTEKEVIQLLLAAERHDRNLLIAMITTGGRRSEVFRWNWHEDINFEERRVRLGTRKTRSSEMRYRWVPMNDMLFSALQDQWKTKLPQSDYVFQNRDERSRYYGERYRWRRTFMRTLCERAKTRSFGFHALRRFFSSLLMDKYKRSLPVVRDLLGHQSATTTDRYAYNISEDARTAVNQINIELTSEGKIEGEKKKSTHGGTRKK